MIDEQLRESLRRLPEAGAGEGFTRAVLARLAEEHAGAKNHAATPWALRLRRRLGSFSLQAPGPRLATAAAAMVVAATLALALIANLDRPGQPEPDTRAGQEADSTLAESTGDALAEAPDPEPRIAAVEDAPSVPPSAPATPDATPDPDVLAGALPDPATDTAPAAVPTAHRTPDAATPGTDDATDGPRALDPEERRRAVERLRQLRREQERLRTRLAALTEAPAPTLVLGGDESLELVLDLNADADPVGGGAGYGARPAGYRPEPEHRRYFN